MQWRPFSRKEVTIRVHAEPDAIQVEGNASVSGDDVSAYQPQQASTSIQALTKGR